MKEKTLKLWDKQFKFIASQKKSVLLQCGIGYGKTFTGAVFICKCVLDYPGKNFMIVARDIPQYKKAIYPEIRKVFDIFGFQEGSHYTYNKQDLKFEFDNGVTIFCVGAVNYDSSFRGPNIAVIWSDETEYYRETAWETMLGRLRVPPALLRCTSTPKGFSHIHQFFNVNSDDSKEIFIAPTYENKLLDEEYHNLLKSTYSPRLYEQEVLARRLNINQGAVYSEFDRKIHVKSCVDTYDPARHQLYFFTDYNIAHYCGCYMYESRGVVYVIGEEHLEFKGSREMAMRIRSKYPRAIIIGDSAGNTKRDVAIDRTNYQHFQDAGLMTKRFRNPPVQSRIISANSNLYHKKTVIDPSAKTLIRDLELVSWKTDGKDIEKSDISLSHSSDAWSYGMWYFLPITGKKSPTSIQVF